MEYSVLILQIIQFYEGKINPLIHIIHTMGKLIHFYLHSDSNVPGGYEFYTYIEWQFNSTGWLERPSINSHRINIDYKNWGASARKRWITANFYQQKLTSIGIIYNTLHGIMYRFFNLSTNNTMWNVQVMGT